jgi:4-amino-4-deoxy-L-arabinose transferase-like glycosyltransferase
MAVGVVQAFLGAASVFLLGVLGRQLWSRRAGVLAAGIMAFYPNLVMHTAALLSETLSIFLVLAALTLVVCSPRSPSRARLVQVGLVLGAAVLVRSVVLPQVPMLLIAWWARDRDWRAALRRTAMVGLAIIAVVLPWTVRNAIRMHAFVPIATNNGDNLCIGYEPTASGVYGAGAACRVEHVQMGGSRDEVLHDRETTRVALRYAKEDVGRLPGLVWRRAKGLFDRDDDAIRAVQSYADPGFIPAGRADRLRLVANGSWLVVGVGGAIGLVLAAWRGRRDSLLVVLAGVSLVVAPLATFADPRFKVPFVPFLCLGLAVLVARLTGSHPTPQTTRTSGQMSP